MTQQDRTLPKSAAYELSEDTPSNPSIRHTLGDVVAARLGRRDFVKAALATTAMAALAPTAFRAAEAAAPSFSFTEIEHGVDQTHHVAPGYDADVLIRWGDPVAGDAPAFDPMNQTTDAQARQFGYNNDYIGFVGLPFGSDNPDHGLLCVNHEYTSAEVMFPNYDTDRTPDEARKIVDIEMAAHGGSVIEIRKDAAGKWQVMPNSKYARRITAKSPMTLSGPAAGHDRLKTSYDATGRICYGTLNNCAGGITPWGTYLMAEENFHGYFRNKDALENHPEKINYERYGVGGEWYIWGQFEDRFDLGKEPNEANKFGWVVEVDITDPSSTPVKRTALGRFKHEGAESIVNRDGRVVVYMGDDQRFDYLYKYVSNGRFDPNNRRANMTLLDDGTLFVAKFNDDGTLDWLPLVYGSGPLTDANGFSSQADVMIETRRAADLLEATPMDRPEDVQPNTVTNKVYVQLTNNSKREPDQINGPNPRAKNSFGQIVEITPGDGDDHGSAASTWDFLVICGDPNDPASGAKWNAAISANGWFGSPDNAATDYQGRLWITTDQGSNWPKTGTADGIWAMETEGDLRGAGRMFFRVPVGAEMCGPRFTPDDKTLFVAVQHPATDGVEDFPGFERESTFEDPATRWPDFSDAMPPRPSVVAITKKDGGTIGS
ncbi:MAG: PhoX family phosphatase [Alphaproteobacteria bacterium]